MSPFIQGLLGGVAQGASKALTQTADMVFADHLAAKKEKRLADIADRNYARDRADTLSDIESQRLFQNTQRTESQDFTAGQNKENRTFQQELADSKLDAFSTFEIGKDGRIYGFNSQGESKAIEGFEGELISFSDLTSLARTSATNLTLMSEADPGYEDAVAFSISLQNALTSKLQSSGLGGADGPTDEFLMTLPKRRGVDGKLYVTHLGKNYVVSE